MRLRAGQRLRRTHEFRAAREQGRRIDCGVFVLNWRLRSEETPAGPARLGVVASKASVGGAVDRNRAKRRLRALFRRHQAIIPAGSDLVLTARAALLGMEFSEIEQRFLHACRKLPVPPALA